MDCFAESAGARTTSGFRSVLIVSKNGSFVCEKDDRENRTLLSLEIWL